MKNFKIKTERIKQNIKQFEFAKRIGITPQYLCLLEKGEVNPKLDLMIKISKELNSTIEELFLSDEE